MDKAHREGKLKVLAIAGSPRRGGNTDLLLREVIAGAQSGGAEVKRIVLSKLSVAPCLHCDRCLKAGRCPIKDDMQGIYRDLGTADRLVIASPIFFMGVTAQTKAMIDRCQALWAVKYVLKLPVAIIGGQERRGLFVSVGGTKGPKLFEPALATIKIWFKTLDFAYAGDLLFRGTDEKGAIAQHPTALSDAFAAGQRLAEG
jgi:multimeric flavodoxin WrbA